MKRSLIVTASIGCLLAVLAVAQVVDWANVEWRFRGSSSLKFAPNVTLQDEDGNWIIKCVGCGWVSAGKVRKV